MKIKSITLTSTSGLDHFQTIDLCMRNRVSIKTEIAYLATGAMEYRHTVEFLSVPSANVRRLDNFLSDFIRTIHEL